MSFALDLSKFKEKTENRSKAVFQKLALDIDRGVVLSTPVDTGRARGGWNVGINNVNLDEAEPDKTGRNTISANETMIQRADLDDVIFVSNNVDYIEYLEDGSSDQAPNGMVAKTLRRFQQFVRESVVEAKRKHP